MKIIWYEDIFYNADKIVHFYYDENKMHILFDNDEQLSIVFSARDYNSFIKFLKDDEEKIIHIKMKKG